MLELCDPELELVQLLPCDEAELACHSGQALPRPLAERASAS